MTDFMENLLSSMSTAFNLTATDGSKPIDIKDDKTLKWRALQNNQYARKVLKKGVSEKTEGFNDIPQIKLENDVQKKIDDQNDDHGKGVETKAKSSSNEKTIEEQQNKNSIEIPVRRLRRSRPLDQNDETARTSNEKVQTPPPKRRGRSKKSVEKKLDDIQIIEDDKSNPKKLRKSDRNSNNGYVKVEDAVNDTDIAISNELETLESNKKSKDDNQSDNKSDGKLKKTRRSTRLEGKTDTDETPPAPSVEIKEEPAKSPPEYKIFDLNSPGESEKSVQSLEKNQKKRGRRSKITPPKVLGSIDISKDLPIVLTKKINLNSLEPPKEMLSSKRPLRRIKPTPKILANDELRYEFETKNIARITACSELAISSSENNPISTEFANKKDVTSGITPITQKQLPIQESSSKKLTKAINYAPILPPARPCPDPETFLNEIKASKINANKSPEDKKLNRKQHRKLLRQKEKHFKKLGLKRNVQNEITDSEASSDDNEEFVPSKKINVGKPNVTLRIRANTNKDGFVAIPSCSKNAINLENQRKHKIKINAQAQNDKSTPETDHLTVKDQSEMIENESPSTKNDTLICLCHKPSHYYTRNTPDTAFCCAVDNIEEQKVGCCNQLSGELLNLLRPSQRVGYMILCKDHTKRMKAHNCCAGCGIFCTQGKFVLCEKQHFFHAECAQKFILNSPYDPENSTDYTSPTLVLKCPHCGLDTPEKTSLVTMKCQSLPVFLPSQKILLKPAKVTISERHQQIQNLAQRKIPLCVELENLIPESVMNVIVREGNNDSSANEFTSKDMFYAVNNDDLERVAEILSSGYDITSKMPEFLNGTCLHLVAHFGTIQMAYLLLCRESSEDFLNMIDKELRTALMCSIIGDKVDILKLFIQCGSDLMKKGPDGMTCLHIAAKVGNLHAVQLIVDSHKNCSNINMFEKFINCQDDGGWTAIVWAAELGFTEIVSLLLNNGASPNICDSENNSVLHWATLSNHAETISVLLGSKIDCSIQNINGDTPLHIACRSSSTRICLMLIANGADLMVKNKAQELPYDCIANEESQCARAVGFNMQIRSFGPAGLRNKIINSDISNGREMHPIQVIRRDHENPVETHEVDELMLPDFKYIKKSILLQNSVQIDYRVSQMRICSCTDGCNSDQCQCSTISIQNWYTPEGRLNGEFNYDDPAMIFECNDVCGCNKLTCKNRVVQNGSKISFQVFECEDHIKGWGVKALTSIPRGTFVAEYTGEILTDLEADRRTDDSYFFDLGASEHCIDANFYGNISRFFNHSCTPNIVPVRVYYEHQDFRFPKIAFFACKEIPDGEELCFDYGDKFWLIKQKYFSCKCRLAKCRYSSKISNVVNEVT